jgi:hypothetical protein
LTRAAHNLRTADRIVLMPLNPSPPFAWWSMTIPVIVQFAITTLSISPPPKISSELSSGAASRKSRSRLIYCP